MSEGINYRRERIERLLEELRYEITRGMMDREIDERLTYTFVVPNSRHIHDGIVLCRFDTVPTNHWNAPTGDGIGPRLRVVK